MSSQRDVYQTPLAMVESKLSGERLGSVDKFGGEALMKAGMKGTRREKVNESLANASMFVSRALQQRETKGF